MIDHEKELEEAMRALPKVLRDMVAASIEVWRRDMWAAMSDLCDLPTDGDSSELKSRLIEHLGPVRKDSNRADTAFCDGCGYFGIDGGPSPVMVCGHPRASTYGYIIHWDSERKNRTSTECPKKRDLL
jgi:hypothetical protein